MANLHFQLSWYNQIIHDYVCLPLLRKKLLASHDRTVFASILYQWAITFHWELVPGPRRAELRIEHLFDRSNARSQTNNWGLVGEWHCDWKVSNNSGCLILNLASYADALSALQVIFLSHELRLKKKQNIVIPFSLFITISWRSHGNYLRANQCQLIV